VPELAELDQQVDLFAPLSALTDDVLRRATVRPERIKHTGQYMSWPVVLVGAALERVFGQPLQALMRSEVFEPLEMKDSWVGMPEERADRYAEQRRWAVLHDCGGDRPRPIPWSEPDGVDPTIARPSNGVRAPSREIGAFYRALLLAREGRESHWLSPAAAWMMTTRHRVGLPEPSGALIDFGLGVELESRHYDKFWMSYGPHCSLSTFGHKGESCFLGFCDPEARAVVTVFVNGQIEGMAHGRRMFRLTELLYEDLGLV
jgi:CubicO group peptidase (beta-lactamase class C family)